MALSIKKLIEKCYETESLLPLLKFAIKLLDYESYYTKDPKYRGPQYTIKIFKSYIQLDSFEVIAEALDFLKKHLDRDNYANMIELMRNEYGTEALSKLMSIRMTDNGKKRNILIVKKE